MFQNIESLLKHPSKIWGGSCGGEDVIVEKVDLPEMRLGDSLAFPDMGAYTLAFISGFNGLPQPVCRYYKQGELIEWNVDSANNEINKITFQRFSQLL